LNLTVARFRVKEDNDSPWDAETERRATLRAVRFEGEYLFGSVPACRLLATEQRPLSDFTVQVTTRTEDRTISGSFPMRISIEKDHIGVETSFGNGNHELSSQVHEAAVKAVRAEIADGFGNEDRLDDFTAKIFEMAGEAAPEETMDPLAVDREATA
jgi:hypothetical protein